MPMMRVTVMIIVASIRSADCILQPSSRSFKPRSPTTAAAPPQRYSKFALLVTPRSIAPSSPRRIKSSPPAPVEIPSPVADGSVTPYDSCYWYHPNIHNWGNIGAGGWFHAFWAPLATYIIDRTSYSGLDVRKMVHDDTRLFPPGCSVLDLCCGTGYSSAPSGGRTVVGVDTSPAMLRMARFLHPGASFEQGNAESFGEDNAFDVVSVMFATHEMPLAGRRRVLRNAMRVARKSVVVVDIDPDFEQTLRAKPMEGATFLSGEPYVLDYLQRMDGDVASVAPVRITAPGTNWRMKRMRLLPKHVVVWQIERDTID